MESHILLRSPPEPRSAVHYDYLALVHGMQPLESTHTDKHTTKNNGDACEDLNEMTDVIDVS
jgi:hypothetical protein